jgi:hypothetical protein
MSTKNTRSGGKFSGNHTTLIPAACTVADVAHACPHVTKISPGFIKAGLRSVKGQRRVKITDDGRSILLAIRDNASQQEIRIFTNNIQEAKLAIAQGTRNNGLAISFKNIK